MEYDLPDAYLYQTGTQYLLQLATRKAQDCLSSQTGVIMGLEEDLDSWFTLCDNLGLTVHIMGTAIALNPDKDISDGCDIRQICRAT